MNTTTLKRNRNILQALFPGVVESDSIGQSLMWASDQPIGMWVFRGRISDPREYIMLGVACALIGVPGYSNVRIADLVRLEREDRCRVIDALQLALL